MRWFKCRIHKNKKIRQDVKNANINVTVSRNSEISLAFEKQNIIIAMI